MLIPPDRNEFIIAFKGNPSLRVIIYLTESLANALNNLTSDVELSLDGLTGVNQSAAEIFEAGKKIFSLENSIETASVKIGKLESLLRELQQNFDCLDDSNPYSGLIFKLIEDFKKFQQAFDALEQDVTPLFNQGINLEEIRSGQLNNQNILSSLIPAISDIGTQLTCFQSSLSNFDLLIKSKIDERENYFSQNESRISFLESEIAQLKDKISTLPGTDEVLPLLQDLESKINVELSHLSCQVSQQDSGIIQLQSKVETIDSLLFLNDRTLIDRIDDLENFLVV